MISTHHNLWDMNWKRVMHIKMDMINKSWWSTLNFFVITLSDFWKKERRRRLVISAEKHRKFSPETSLRLLVRFIAREDTSRVVYEIKSLGNLKQVRLRELVHVLKMLSHRLDSKGPDESDFSSENLVYAP